MHAITLIIVSCALLLSTLAHAAPRDAAQNEENLYEECSAYSQAGMRDCLAQKAAESQVALQRVEEMAIATRNPHLFSTVIPNNRNMQQCAVCTAHRLHLERMANTEAHTGGRARGQIERAIDREPRMHGAVIGYEADLRIRDCCFG